MFESIIFHAVDGLVCDVSNKQEAALIEQHQSRNASVRCFCRQF